MKKNKINFREYILGGQDGLVNVLGLVLGVASATQNSSIVIISGIVATVAESVSMAAVAFTSTEAAKDYYKSKTTKKVPIDFKYPIKSTIIVGLSTLIGSIIPLISFFLLPVKQAIIGSLIVSAIALFTVGALKAKLSLGNWKKSGMELLIIGMISALLGYGVGLLLKGYGA